MQTELTYLIWSAALGFVYLNAQAILFRMQVGIKQANNTRDSEPEPNLHTGRATRALRNFLETYGLFVALAAASAILGKSNGLTQWGTYLWFWARIVYLPLYVLGLSPWRSYVWTISLIGLILLFVGVAF